MNGSEIREIKRRFDEGLSNIRTIYGCYVNAAGEIVSEMELSAAEMDAEERAMYANLFRKTISGTAGRHLLPIGFDPKNIEDNDCHRGLMQLRSTHLEDSGAREALYNAIIENYDNDSKSYAILLAADTYDILSKDDDEDEWSEDSESQLEYFVCSICGVKDPKAALRYRKEPKAFRGASTGSLLSNPVLGFMFPSFNDRQTDIYEAAYYVRKVDDIHPELIEGLFRPESIPTASETKKELFGSILYESLGPDCTLDVMTSLQASLASKLSADEEESSTPEVPFTDIGTILKAGSVPEEKIDAFVERASESFDKDGISAHTLVEKNSFRIKSSDAEIIVDPDAAIRLRTKKIDGVTYFLVPVGSDVTVNGMKVTASAKDDQ